MYEYRNNSNAFAMKMEAEVSPKTLVDTYLQVLKNQETNIDISTVGRTSNIILFSY